MRISTFREFLAASAWAFIGIIFAATVDLAAAAPSMREQIEGDWRRQAEAWLAQPQKGKSASTQSDAAGAVDGVKNGAYGFHTQREPNPWWQVDLGEPVAIVRIVVFNRQEIPRRRRLGARWNYFRRHRRSRGGSAFHARAN